MTFDPDEFLTGQKSQPKPPSIPADQRELSLSERRAIAQRSKDDNYEATKRTAVGLGLWMLVILGVAAAGLGITYWNYSKTAPPGFSVWYGYHVQLVNAVKSTMHDPTSFEHVKTQSMPTKDGFDVTMQFRGKNSFGAKVLGHVKATLDTQGNVLDFHSQELEETLDLLKESK